MTRNALTGLLVCAAVYTLGLALAHVALILTGHDGDPLIDGAFQTGAGVVLALVAGSHVANGA